ncbi:MAG: 50S ribosomal protein L10 [Clostridiaceae bacterium]|nr:50S ribosomal protein L10 [Clostridiaceae bacterium]
MPSPKILEKKKQVVSSLVDELKSANAIVLNDYTGLSVAQDTELRAKFREAGVTYRVIKNTVLIRAFEQLGISGFEEELTGPTAVAFSDDVVLAPKLSKEASDKIKVFEIKGGAVDGAKVEIDKIIQLASIPDEQTLRGQLVSGLIFPITSLAMTLNALAEKGAEEGKENVIDLVAEKSEESEQAEAPEATEEAQAETAEEATEE